MSEPNGTIASDRPPRARWTFLRLPWPVVRGGLVAALTAVTLVVVHIGGWDPRVPGWPLTWLPVYAVGLPVALGLLWLVVAPILRRLAVRGRLTRRATLRLGGALFGVIALVWMVALDVGPPSGVEARTARAAGAAVDWAVPALRLVYNAVLTPAAFAVYGVLSALAGWRAGFGTARAVDARDWLG